MDLYLERIKNIIQPYEEKIKYLEEIISQKDFELAVLRDNLFVSNIQNNNAIDKNINIIFRLNSNTLNEQCLYSELFCYIKKRVCKKLNINQNMYKFIYIKLN